MRWGLTGYYGFGNLGDDLMLAVLARGLARLDADARVAVLCPPGSRPERVPGEAVMGPRRVIASDGLKARLAALRGVDALVFGGGTCLHRFGFCDLHGSLAARALGRPVRWVGVGAEDPGGGVRRWKARLALALCGGAGFRDAGSLERVRGVAPGFERGRVTGDLAYLLESVMPAGGLLAAIAGEDAPDLVVSWRSLEGYLDPVGEARVLEHAARAVAARAGELGFRRIRVLDLAEEVDGAANRRLAEAVRKELEGGDGGGTGAPELEVCGPTSLIEKLGILAGAGLVVSVRLHGWLAAKLLGTPAVGVAYASKVRALARDLDRPAVVGLDELSEGPGGLEEALVRELGSPAEFENLEAARAGAAENFELIAELLDRATES